MFKPISKAIKHLNKRGDQTSEAIKHKMNILEKIIAHKKQEIAQQQQIVPISKLEKSPFFERTVLSARQFIEDESRVGIIAEIKRKSPSKGIIHPNVQVEQISKGYVAAGVSAISVLTDTHFFGGSAADLTMVRQLNQIPVLRKDFIVSEYQLLEAKAIGADIILLIAAALTPKDLFRLAKFAKSLGLEMLMEVHNQAELERSLCPELDLVGVNNRDLTRFKVDINTSLRLVEQIPNDFVKVSESGISKPETIVDLKKAGFDGFLIGECFMKTPEPEVACMEFISTCTTLYHDHLGRMTG